MSELRLIFTKNSSVLSRLIRFATSDECSHFAIVFDNKWVLHSNLFGVHMDWLSTFKKKSKIVYEVTHDLSLEKQEEIYASIMDNFDHSPYDCKALLFFGFCVLLNKLFGVSMPLKNAWGENDSFLCTEMAHVMPDWLFDYRPQDYSMTTPFQVYQSLKKEIET